MFEEGSWRTWLWIHTSSPLSLSLPRVACLLWHSNMWRSPVVPPIRPCYVRTQIAGWKTSWWGCTDLSSHCSVCARDTGLYAVIELCFGGNVDGFLLDGNYPLVVDRFLVEMPLTGSYDWWYYGLGLLNEGHNWIYRQFFIAALSPTQQTKGWSEMQGLLGPAACGYHKACNKRW